MIKYHFITAHSSSGLGHRPLKAEITGSNPVCATTSLILQALGAIATEVGLAV